MVKKKKRRAGLEVSPLKAHKQKGKLLQPPMNQIGGMLLSSWVNEVLPEMLWAALMLERLPRKECFEKFQAMLSYVSEHIDAFDKKQLDMSGIAGLDQESFDGLFKSLCEEEAVKARFPSRHQSHAAGSKRTPDSPTHFQHTGR